MEGVREKERKTERDQVSVEKKVPPSILCTYYLLLNYYYSGIIRFSSETARLPSLLQGTIMPKNSTA